VPGSTRGSLAATWLRASGRSAHAKVNERRAKLSAFSKAAVSQSSARLLLQVYNLWSLFVRVVKNQSGHTEAITSRYELTSDSTR